MSLTRLVEALGRGGGGKKAFELSVADGDESQPTAELIRTKGGQLVPLADLKETEAAEEAETLAKAKQERKERKRAKALARIGAKTKAAAASAAE